MRSFAIGDATAGGERLLILSGPCVVESEAMVAVAERMQDLCAATQAAVRCSRRRTAKANRSSGKSFAGLGMDEALAVLAKVKRVNRRARS